MNKYEISKMFQQIDELFYVALDTKLSSDDIESMAKKVMDNTQFRAYCTGILQHCKEQLELQRNLPFM